MVYNPFQVIDSRLNKIEQLLSQLIAQHIPTLVPEDEVGGIALAQAITGLKRATIYCHVHKGIIPHFKRGGKLYFSKTDLLEWIKQEKPPKEAPVLKLPSVPTTLFPRFNKIKKSIP